MRVRFWGTRGSIPVSLTWRDVRDRLVEALVAGNGQQLDTMAKANAFVEQHFPFSLRRTYGGHSACVESAPGSNEYFVCDMGSHSSELECHDQKCKPHWYCCRCQVH